MAKKATAQKKAAAKKTSSQKISSATETTAEVKNFAAFKLSSTETIYPSDAMVLECIRTHAGESAVIESGFTLGGLAVNATSLAGCINVKLGTKFKSSSFPPTMTVGACLLKVRAKTA